jgi:hypothetical protein
LGGNNNLLINIKNSHIAKFREQRQVGFWTIKELIDVINKCKEQLV